jgi:heme-degrading monooxygenase HmoA
VIIERAILAIKPGQAEAFEAAFAQARPFIEAADGFHRLEMRRGIEVPDSYLLLVWWEDLNAHMKGFRQSEAFKAWRALLGPHFAAPPAVEHYGDAL